MDINPKVYDWGFEYIKRQLPLVQLEDQEKVKNIVTDLMWLGKHMHIDEPVCTE